MGLFPHYEADPGAVRGTATDVLDGSTKVSDLRVDVDSRHDVAVSVTGGILTGPLVSSTRPFDTSADTTAQCATIAGGALNLFAKDIDTFNAGIDKLNARYDVAAASHFNVDAEQFYNHGTMTQQQRDQAYHHAVSSAQSALTSSLTAEEHQLREELDSGADVVVAILDKGPSKDAAVVLALNGELPQEASVTFPEVIDDFKLAFDPGAAVYALQDFARYTAGTIEADRALQQASLALLQGKNLADAETLAVLKVVGGDATDMRVLNQYFRGEETVSALRAGLQEAQATRAGFNLLDAAAATSKFAKGIAGLTVLSGIYDLGWNPNGDTGIRRDVDYVGDAAGIIGGGGTLLIAAGILTAPISGPIVLGATAIAAGIALGTLIYDHWDDIKAGVSTAYHWTSDRLGDAADALGDAADTVGDGLEDAGDWVADKAKDIPVIGGLFG